MSQISKEKNKTHEKTALQFPVTEIKPNLRLFRLRFLRFLLCGINKDESKTANENKRKHLKRKQRDP